MKSLPIIFSENLMFTGRVNYDTLAFTFILAGLLLIAYSIIVLKSRHTHKRNTTNVLLSQNNELRNDAYQDALKILDRARVDSLKILGRAQSKAQSVLNSTYAISKESRDKLDNNLRSIYEKQEKSLSEVTKDLLDSYKSAVEEGKEENIRTLYEATESMKNEALKGVLRTRLKLNT
jgi:cell division septum initiation protein DivIVA